MPRLIGRKKRRGSMNLAKNVLIDFGTDKNTDSNVNTNLSSTVNTKASTETNTNTGTNTNTNNKSYSLTIENSSEANILYCDKAKNSNLNNKGNKARDNTQYPVVYNKRVHSKNNQLENLQTQPDIDGGVDFSAHSDLAKNLKLNLDLSASLNQPIITDSQEATSVKSQSGGILFNIASVSTDFSNPSSKTSIKDNEKIYNSSSEQVVVKFRNSQTIPELSFTESSSIDANNNALSDRGIECSNNTSEKISTSSSATTNATLKMIQPGNGNAGNEGVCAQEGKVQENQQHTEERPEETSRIGEPSLDQDTEGNTGIMIGKGKNQKNKTKKENKTPVYSFKRWIWGSNSEGSSNISSPQKEKAINIFKRQKLSVEAQETTIERQDSVDIPSSCGTEMSIANRGPSDNSNNEEAVVDAIKDTGEEVDTSKSITNIAQQGTQGLLEIEENHEREHKQEQEKQKINNSSGSGDFILNQNDKGKTKEGVEGAEKINKTASEKSIGIKELVEVETKAIQMEEQVTNTDSRNNSISYSVNERGGARDNEGEHGNEIGEGSGSEFEFERRSKYRSTTKWIWWKSKKEDQKVETEQYDYEQGRQEVEEEKHGQQIKVGTKRQLGIKQTVVRIHDGAETNNNEQGSLEEHNKTEGEALKVKDTGDVDDGDIKMMVDREEVQDQGKERESVLENTVDKPQDQEQQQQQQQQQDQVQDQNQGQDQDQGQEKEKEKEKEQQQDQEQGQEIGQGQEQGKEQQKEQVQELVQEQERKLEKGNKHGKEKEKESRDYKVGWREYISSFYYSSEKVEKSIDIQEREAGQKNKAGSTIEKRQEKQSERDGKGGEASENKLGMKSIVEPKLEYRRYRNEAGTSIMGSLWRRRNRSRSRSRNRGRNSNKDKNRKMSRDMGVDESRDTTEIDETTALLSSTDINSEDRAGFGAMDEFRSKENQKIHNTVVGMKKIVILGVHGWFPNKIVQFVAGEPTGKSERFCGRMKESLEEYLWQEHGVRVTDESGNRYESSLGQQVEVVMMPLAADGMVEERVEKLMGQLVMDKREEILLEYGVEINSSNLREKILSTSLNSNSNSNSNPSSVPKTSTDTNTNTNTNTKTDTETDTKTKTSEKSNPSSNVNQAQSTSTPMLPIDITVPNKLDRKRHLQSADMVLVAAHSQGTPVSVILLERLIEIGLIEPRRQRVGLLAMAGISHGPFAALKDNIIIRYIEAAAATRELFQFGDPSSYIVGQYIMALGAIMQRGVRVMCVASWADEVVPFYSAIMSAISHPNLYRAVCIKAFHSIHPSPKVTKRGGNLDGKQTRNEDKSKDGSGNESESESEYECECSEWCANQVSGDSVHGKCCFGYAKNNFLIELVLFCIKLRNFGFSDLGLSVYLSESMAGNFWGSSSTSTPTPIQTSKSSSTSTTSATTAAAANTNNAKSTGNTSTASVANATTNSTNVNTHTKSNSKSDGSRKNTNTTTVQAQTASSSRISKKSPKALSTTVIGGGGHSFPYEEKDVYKLMIDWLLYSTTTMSPIVPNFTTHNHSNNNNNHTNANLNVNINESENGSGNGNENEDENENGSSGSHAWCACSSYYPDHYPELKDWLSSLVSNIASTLSIHNNNHNNSDKNSDTNDSDSNDSDVSHENLYGGYDQSYSTSPHILYQPINAYEPLNPYFLPSILVSLLTNPQIKQHPRLGPDVTKLVDLFRTWVPQNKAEKELKYKLEPLNLVLF